MQIQYCIRAQQFFTQNANHSINEESKSMKYIILIKILIE